MEKRQKKIRSKIWYSYFVSYLGIALIALAFFSILLAWQVSDNMRNENLRVTEEKMFVAAEDIQRQVDAMHSVVYQIASMPDFRSVHFKQNKYEEAEMVKKLKQFRYASVLSDYFFVKYQKDDSIYTSDGTTLPFVVYSEKNIEEPFGRDVKQKMEQLSTKRNENCILVRTGDSRVLLIFSLKQYAVSSVGLDGCVSFEIREDEVENRLHQMTGKLDGTLQVYYDNGRIYGSEEGEACLEVTSSSGNVKILFRQNQDSYFFWSDLFSGVSIVVLMGIIILLLVFSVFMAWRNYLPIRKLADKYRVEDGLYSGSELEDIDGFIEELQQKEEKNHLQLQEQYKILREQMLRLIASGGYAEQMEERLEVLNIHLPGPVYGKMECCIKTGTAMDNRGVKWCTAMEDLSGEGTAIYAFEKRKEVFTVLFSAEEEYQIQELYEAILALFEVHQIKIKISVKNVCRDLRDLHGEMTGSYPVGANKENGESLEENFGYEPDRQGESSVKQNRKAELAVQYIKENFTRYDLSLDSIAQEFHVASTYLCRILKQQTGVSYKEYLTKLRMEEAKRLLGDSTVTIADVCQRVGYSNVSHFIKIFQKYEGVTPAKFRDQG